MKSVHAIIHGRVQGVWFRAWTSGEAQKLGLDGWVRNRIDGTVEAVFAGPEAQVEAMLLKCKSGPPLARVDRIETQPANVPDQAGFHKLSTV